MKILKIFQTFCFINNKFYFLLNRKSRNAQPPCRKKRLHTWRGAKGFGILWCMKTQANSLFSSFDRILVIGAVVILAACSSGGVSKYAKRSNVGAGYYRVQPGDTLYRIAKRYGQSVGTLAAWNNIADVSQIEVGQVLRVRRRTSGSTTSTPSTHRNYAAARPVTPIIRPALKWPVDKASGNIIQRYNGVTSKGIDIAGVKGQNVRAAAAGKVLYAGNGVRGYGKLILLSHSNSIITAYAHNDMLLVQNDQQVSAGQAIATMGSSDADRVKLHFEVRAGGKAVDPIPYLPH